MEIKIHKQLSRGFGDSIESSGISDGTLVVSHDGESIYWSSSPFDRTELQQNQNVFSAINGYWSRLPKNKQAEIFEIYRLIKEKMDNSRMMETLILDLMPMVANLLDNYHRIEDVRYWLDYNVTVFIPDTISEQVHFEQGSPTTEEKTYLVESYKQLVTLCVIMRCMVPIWGEFILRTKDDAGTTFKEFYAYKLLSRSEVNESNAMNKLLKYIEHQLPAPANSSPAAVLKGIGTEDYPSWVLARVLVRRVCICDINANIIKFIYQYVRQKNSGQKTSGKNGGINISDTVLPKFVESNNSDSDSNHSILEGYKIQTETSIGDIGVVRKFLSNPLAVAKQIEPTISERLVIESLHSVQALNSVQIQPAQLCITQWVLKDVNYPRSYDNLKKINVLNAIAITQAILMHRGQPIMAALCSAIVFENMDEMRITGIESKGKISKEVLEELDRLYPFKRVFGNKKSNKPVNVAVADIDVVAKALSEREWTLTIPDHWMEAINPPIASRIYSTPFDLRNLLGQMVITLVKRGNE